MWDRSISGASHNKQGHYYLVQQLRLPLFFRQYRQKVSEEALQPIHLNTPANLSMISRIISNTPNSLSEISIGEERNSKRLVSL